MLIVVPKRESEAFLLLSTHSKWTQHQVVAVVAELPPVYIDLATALFSQVASTDYKGNTHTHEGN